MHRLTVQSPAKSSPALPRTWLGVSGKHQKSLLNMYLLSN